MPKIPLFPPKPRRVEILAVPSVQLLDVAGPLQVFATANSLAAARGEPLPYDVQTVATASPVMTSAGVGLTARRLPRPGRPLDTLVLAGGSGVHRASADPALLRWIRARAGDARRVASVCTGAFLLAATGLLAGRRVATHWMDCAALARRHPGLKVEGDPIWLRDGRYWSSAGVTAGIDLTLAMVEEDLGHGAAMAVARDLVVFLRRPGGQAQFSVALWQPADDGDFAALDRWIAAHLAEPLPVARLAAEAGMSERSFLRRYRAATGRTPARAVEAMRVAAARQLLADSRLKVKQIAARCGFGAEETLRRSFLRQHGVTPQDWRARFAR